MKKLVTLVYNNQYGFYSGYYEEEGTYNMFTVADDEKVLEFPVLQKFRDYDHFVGVFSKFNPYTFFWKKPISIKELDLETVKNVFQRVNDEKDI